LERHFGRLTALAASGLEHLAASTARSTTAATGAGIAPATAAAARSALGLAGRPTFGTTVGLVLEAFAREELLFSGAENELAVAINAAQGFISIHS
jgi:hypothetical protein